MSRSLLFALTVVLLSLSSVHAERLPLRSFTIADGLANNGINKIVKDSRGFLWFCTANGLSRFDGYSFTNFGTEQGLPHPVVTDLLETRSGDYWIATYGGVVRFNPRGTPINQVHSVDENSSVPPMFSVVPSDDLDRRAKAVSVLFERRDGTVWCGTYKGLFQLTTSDGRIRLHSVEIGVPSGAVEQSDVRDMIEDQSQSLWIGTSSGLYRRWSDGSSARYTEQDGFPDQDISDLLQDSRGHLWAATFSGGFFEFAADSSHAPPSMIRSYRSTDGLTTDWVFQLFETSSGQIKIATNKGLAEFYPESAKQARPLKLYTTSNGLSYREINALAEDSGGNLWLGTISGAMKLARDGFVSYGESDGLMWVGAILEDQNGGICFRGEVRGDQNATVFEGARLNAVGSDNSKSWPQFGRYFDERFSWFTPDALGVYFGWVAEKVTLQAKNGEWWIGTGAGLYRYAAMDDFTKIKTARPLAHYTTTETKLTSTQIYRLFEDSRGDIWASTLAAPSGFSHWHRATDTWENLGNTPGLPSLTDQAVNSIGEDREGSIWVGFNTGVARFRQSSWKFFDAKDKFPPGNIQRIYSDSVGRLWLSSTRSGLIRIDNPGAESPTLHTYTTADGLSSNQLDVMVEDLQGDIYVGSDRGLDRLNPTTGRVKHYSVADGLAPGTTYDALRARDGTLWFGTRQGLSRFTPTADRVTAPPPILISSLEVAGKRQNISALGETNFRQADLSPGENQMHIEFVGVSFAPGEVLRYEYRLEGSDNDWSVPTNQRAVNYAGLAPGAYRFLVRAINSDGVISGAPATITFTVLPPVWRRWWFIVLVAVSFSALGFFLYRYRVARIYELANIRTRIATDLHDDVGSGLSQVSILSEVISRRVGHTDGVGEQLATIGSLSRDLVDSMSDIVWAINPGRDRLSDLSHRMRRFASDVFSAKGIEFSFEDLHEGRDLGLGPEMRRELYLIFKEAVNNVARHSACTFVKIRFATNRGNMELAVHDNGHGFDQSLDQEGNGLINMKLRAKKLGGELRIGSNNGDGTAVKLTVPLTRSGWWGLRPRS